MNKFIYGENQDRGIVNISVSNNGEVEINGEYGIRKDTHMFYVLTDKDYDGMAIRLKGDLHYKWAYKFKTKREMNDFVGKCRGKKWDYFVVYNSAEAFMIRNGHTYYKGMKPSDVSILSFDIETTGLNPNTDSCLLITNTFRRGGKIERRVFSYSDYKTDKEMILAWCHFVRDKNPSVLTGHNIFGFDIPFLNKRAGYLPIGRDESNAIISKFSSEFKKDDSQSYSYNNVIVQGREIIDTFFLSIKYDVGRKYPNYRLKDIIKYEGLEVEGRQHYNASEIRNKYNDAAEWEKIVKYAEHDADDALALYDLMIPSYFYYAQSIPKTMQQIINGRSGSQINAFMLRAYLSDGHSVPKASHVEHFKGATSFGNPGIYKDVGKVDVASLYPSIILQYNICDIDKDPSQYFLKMVQFFTAERLENKRLAKETGDRHYKDLEQAQKIIINSAYGFMGAVGLNFNSPENAENVTRLGREILASGLKWAESRDYTIVNADTDSFSYTYRGITKDKFINEIKELNSIFPDRIKWEDDGFFKTVIIVKAKNYVLEKDNGEVVIKGSGLKATMKEKALKKFIKETINYLLKGDTNGLVNFYNDFICSVDGINADNITDWCSRKTVTKAILQPKRTNEQRIKDAIDRANIRVQEGDKVHIFFEEDEKLALPETFNGTISKSKLYGKIFSTIKIFSSVIDIKQFLNYSLKRNQKLLESKRAS